MLINFKYFHKGRECPALAEMTNVVYRITTDKGYTKIGHTTKPLSFRMFFYEALDPYLVGKVKNEIYVQVLYHHEEADENLLKANEMFCIREECRKILSKNGITLHNAIVNPFKAEYLGYYLKAKLLNQRIDKIKQFHPFHVLGETFEKYVYAD